MTVSRRARAIGNLGGLGASHQKLPLSPGEVMPKLRIVSASIYYDKREIPIWHNGKWLGKKFPALRNRDCLFRLQVSGQGKAIIGAVFNDTTGNDCWLFVRRVSAGEHFASVQIPFAELPKFRFVVGGKADARINTRFLSNREKKGLSSNMLLLSETKNSYYTQSLGGYAGLGSGHSGMTDDYHPGFIKRADDEDIKTVSGVKNIWSGKLSKHRWHKHGFSGKPETFNLSKGKGEAGDAGPLYVSDNSGYYAFRGSTYQMTYYPDGTMKGYDAMENLKRGMPAGVPICMVMQYFVHDNPQGIAKIADTLGAGPQHSSLGWPTWSDVKNTASAMPGTKFIADTIQATQDFIDDPSLVNAAGVILAPAGGNSNWHFADNVTMKGNKVFLVDHSVFYGKGDGGDRDTFEPPKDKEGLVVTNPTASAIPYKLDKDDLVKPTFKSDGKTFNKKDYAMNVEWYNPKTKTWSQPRPHPPFDFTTDSKGKIKFVFRVPRQLDPKSDASAIQRGIKNGFPDYSYERDVIAKAYPSFSRSASNNIQYNLLGRIEGKDSTTEERASFTQTIGGKQFSGKRSIKAVLYCDPPSHNRAGFFHQSGSGSMDTLKAFSIHVADPAKFTYLDNPEIDFSYYVEGEMKPDSVVVVIGKALGTMTSTNTILSTRYWKNGIPENERPDFGNEIPPGDSPEYVRLSIAPPNAQKPRTYSGREGTESADFLELVGHITTNDLRDKINVKGEEVLRKTFQEIFDGTELNVSWFSKAGLTGHDPKDPTKYLIKGSMGETYSFPFSIAWFKLPKYYHGPYLDYDDAGKLQQIEGRPYAISDPNNPEQQIHILTRTPFNKLMQQKWDVVAETQQQLVNEEEGYTKDMQLAINDMDYDAIDVSEIEALNAQERQIINDANKGTPKVKDPRMVRYTNDWFKANYKFGNKDVVLKPETQPPVIAGFSNQSNFYVEDVTEKWGTLNGAAYTNDDFDVNMMPLPMPGEEEEETPFIGFAGLSGLGNVSIADAMKTVGGGTGTAAGAFTVNFLEEVDDLSAGQMLMGAGMSVFAIGGIAALTYAALSGGGSGLAKMITATGKRKATIIKAKAEAKDKTGGAIAGLFAKPKPSD
tara:strand:- start:10657 stop:13962 length:3306 start_codon:yes stop_codon:yes gene_type:complete